MKVTIDANEIHEREVKPFSRGAHIFFIKKHIGKIVKIIVEEPHENKEFGIPLTNDKMGSAIGRWGKKVKKTRKK